MNFVKFLVAGVLLVAVSLPVCSQSVEQIKADGKNYIYGEGYGVTQAAADEAALANLINQISVSVKSEFVSEEREKVLGDDSSTSEKNYKSIIQTYSSATLHNTERLIIKQEPDACVFRYIKRAEIDKIFEARQNKALEYMRLGDDALNDAQLDDALKYYYWALCLARSLRYPTNVKVWVGDKEQSLITCVPAKIDDICSDISLKLVPAGEGVYRMLASYNGRPIRSMDYTYNDGMGYGAIYSVRDGEGVIELHPSASAPKVTVKVEYMFNSLAVVDDEVKTLVALQQDIFRHAYIDLLLPSPGTAQQAVMASNAGRLATNAKSSLAAPAGKKSANSADMSRCLQTVEKVGGALQSGDLSSVRPLFTADAFLELNKILGYGRYTVGNSYNLECVENESEGTLVCRGLPCLFKFSRQRTFNEQLSFTFTGEKISHVALGLGKQMSEEEIACHGDWGLEARKLIVSFLENYRTAYATKNSEFMERVFDDNAVIIVGHRLQRDARYNDGKFLNNEYVKLTRKSKEEFMRDLKASFRSKEYINLHFSNCEVVQLRPGEDRYGIQLKQEYYSNNYGDTGYLYLLLDLTNPKLPIIHVRTWQPDPDPDFGVISAGFF